MEIMSLKVYLLLNKMTVADLARDMGYSRGHMSAVINGTLVASERMARQIEAYTNGYVKAKTIRNKKAKASLVDPPLQKE